MAISKNLWLQGASQKLAGAVLYQVAGETRIREQAASVANPRTSAQMTQRVKLSNLINFYRANRVWMKRAFENKPRNNSDYNRFVSLNLTANPIYLTKQEANAGACVVAPYRVTEGTLPSVEFTQSGQNWFTNIFVAGLSELTAQTTIGDFSQAVIAANAGVREGDQISFIRLTQMTNSTTGQPYIIVREYEVLLRSSSAELLAAYLPLEYFTIADNGGNSALQVVNSGLAGGFTMVLSRTLGGTIYVSTQDIIVANNEQQIASHSGQTALDAAIASYGEGEEVFLSSATAETLPSGVVPLSVVSISYNGASYIPGDTLPYRFSGGSELLVYLSADHGLTSESGISSLFLNYNEGGGIDLDSEPLGAPNQLTLTFEDDKEFDTGASAKDATLRIVCGNLEFSVPFKIAASSLE